MADKCRICGYVFKRGDGAICPECFTARDDELKFMSGDFKKNGPLASRRRKEKLGDFLADELKEEFHEDISMKKELDHEDARSTRAYTSEGANVKNETFKEAFDERRSRNRTEPGRVYTNTSSGGSASGTNYTRANNSAYYNGQSTANRTNYGYNRTVNNSTQSTYRNTSQSAGSTPNQQTPFGTGQRYTTNTYSYGTYNNQQRNRKSGKSAAAIVIMIITFAMFSVITGILAGIDEDSESTTDRSTNSYTFEMPDISMPDINIPNVSIPDISIPDIKIDNPLSHKLDASYDIYTIYLSDYEKGATVPDALSDIDKRNFVYPIEDKVSSDETYREVTFMFYVDGIENTENIPVLESMILISKIDGEESCVSLIYGLVTDTSNLLNGQYTMYVTFIVPDSADEFDLDIDYNGKNEPNGYTYIDGFSYDTLDAWNGRANDDSSENS